MLVRSKNYNRQVEFKDNSGQANYVQDFFKKYIPGYDTKKNYDIPNFDINWLKESFRHDELIGVLNKGHFQIINDRSAGIHI